MDYKILPGIYAAGNPGRNSPVLVTSNYKLTFDMLRKELQGIDAWIMVMIQMVLMYGAQQAKVPLVLQKSLRE
jgi:CO dehydrogenase/acetyl-CoA synthase gamma subunit (corrinoid Fe-S protein)